MAAILTQVLSLSDCSYWSYTWTQNTGGLNAFIPGDRAELILGAIPEKYFKGIIEHKF